MSRSSESNDGPFPQAAVYWKTPKRVSRSRDAWLSISSFLRWKYVGTKGGAPENFSSFRGQPCLALDRLPENGKWKDVVDVVDRVKTRRGYAMSVTGTLSGHSDSRFRPMIVDLVIVAGSELERNALVDTMRIRISPWRLLYRRIKRILIKSTISPDVLRAMFNCVRSTTEGLPSSGAPQNIELFGPAMDGVNVLSGFVETVATVVKKSAPLVKDTAENVADVAKCVALVSSAFQVVALCASLAEMGLEMKRGYEEWPRMLTLVEELRCVTVESMLPVLHPDGYVNEILVKHVFEVQEELMDLLAGVEKEVMRGGSIQSVMRFLKSPDLKIAEETMKRLKSCVVDVVQSAGIAENTKAVSDIRKEVQEYSVQAKEVANDTKALAGIKDSIKNQSAHMEEVAKNTKELVGIQKVVQEHAKNVRSPCLRPGLTPYFVGREEELEKLRTILDRHGSAAIMQYGGVGKTQLMVAFAERSEKRGWIPGGCYWIRAHGDRAQFMESLASFTESLAGNPLMDKDRGDLSTILGTLKKTLDALSGEWLMCFDNADSSEVNAIVGEVCRLLKECTSVGWVLVTSRQGGRTLWNGMSSSQKLKLEPLGVEQAMAALLRWKEELLEVEVSDIEMIKKLYLMQLNEPEEYKWLLKLSGDDKVYGLGGLPLAIAQAGSFVHRHGVSFSKYASLYRRMRQCKDVVRLFPEVEDRGLEEKNQRMIWATWKANLVGLSEQARRVLFAFALFDHKSVPDELLKALDPDLSYDELAYTEIVQNELVNGASFLQMDMDGERVTFGMHRLIRDFILLEIKASDRTDIDPLMRATRSCLNAVKPAGVLRRRGSFGIMLPHVLSLLAFVSDDQYSFNSSIPLSSSLLALYPIGTEALCNLGRTVEASPLCRGWHRLLKEVYGENRDNHDVMTALRIAGTVSMNNGAYAVAEKYVLEFLEISERLYGKESDHVDIARTFRQLGRLARGKRQFDEAEKWYRKSLEMMNRIYGEGKDHMDIACVMDTLGTVITDKGRADGEGAFGIPNKEWMEDAERWHRRSLDMLKRLLGKDTDHFLVMKVLNSLGQCCLEKNYMVEAEHLFLQGLEMHRRIHGSQVDHVDVSKVLKNLGCIESRRGNYYDADNWYSQCYEMRLRLHGDGTCHPDIAKILFAMAHNDYDAGFIQKAVSKLKESIEMERQIYGEDNRAVSSHADSLERWEKKAGPMKRLSERSKRLSDRKGCSSRSFNHHDIQTSHIISKIQTSSRRRLRPRRPPTHAQNAKNNRLRKDKHFHQHDAKRNHTNLTRSQVDILRTFYQPNPDLDEDNSSQQEALRSSTNEGTKRQVYGNRRSDKPF